MDFVTDVARQTTDDIARRQADLILPLMTPPVRINPYTPHVTGSPNSGRLTFIGQIYDTDISIINIGLIKA
jgi:hypothetical protein